MLQSTAEKGIPEGVTALSQNKINKTHIYRRFVMFYCIVAGSRSFTDYQLLSTKLDRILSNQSDVTIVSGCAHGADALARRYAQEHGYAYIGFPAYWKTFGKSAGYRRNEAMHRYISGFEHRGCVCFWDGESRGTQHNFKLAEKYNNPLRVIKF